MKTTPHATDIYVGQQIRAYRKLRGLSQSDLGKALNVTFQQIQKYENGSNRVSSSKLFSISQTLDIYIGSFFPAGSQ